jgi:hypothetical protein
LKQKNVTPAFDRLVSGGCTFGDLTILVDFWFDGGMIVEVPRLPLNWGPRGLLLFVAMFPVDGIGTKSRLDR